LQAVSLRIQTVASHNAMAEAMKGVTKAMMTMNRRMNLPAMQKIMMEFEKQSEMMDMKEEMMSDTMDDVFEAEDEEEEVDVPKNTPNNILLVRRNY
jgi:charged multivesicular body protein 2A